MRLRARLIIIIFLISVVAVVTFISFKDKLIPSRSIKIGLFVTLTGVYPDLGRQIRDGALLAVEEINKNKGINGRQVDLIIKDNRYNFKQALENINSLIEEGSIVLIGPATSSQAMNLLPIINEKKVLTISPSASSSLLTGKDDYFIRVRQSNRDDAQMLGSYAKKIGINSISFIYDNTNLIYTNDFIDNFISSFGTSNTTYSIPFDPDVVNFKNLASHIVSYKSDAVLIIAEIYSTALLIQNLRKLDKKVVIFSSPWAKSNRLIENTGIYSEGIITVDSVDDNFKGDVYQRYRKAFFERYGYYPGFGADTSYETIFMIKKALETNPDPAKLKETIINISEFDGLQGRFKIDRFGDAVRKPFILKIENKNFVRIDNH
ncbi:MAG: ABC transporter substrate-binding protein [Thermodesulfovibrionales bacterium]|nr:ABC transporter substrate-binding protein [Thermodesulfovibrionales bacterium]